MKLTFLGILFLSALFLFGCTQQELEINADTDSSTENSDTNTQQPVDNPLADIISTEPIVCNDVDCFIEASKNCSLAIWTTEYNTTFEITGIQNNLCIVARGAPMDDECPFETIDLTAMLERWKQQIYSTEDWQTCPQQWKALPSSDIN